MKHAFQFFVHKTAGIIKDIDMTLNLPEAAFYHLDIAEKYGCTLFDGLNMVAIYDAQGKLVKILKEDK